MKITNLTNGACLSLVVLALALPVFTARAASDIAIGPTESETGLNNNDGEWQNMWGPAFTAISFDAANPPPSGDTQGSVYIQATWAGSAADNFCIGSAGNWWGAVTFDGSQYTSIEMDIKYDSASTITPASTAHLQLGFDAGYSFQQVTNVSFDPSTQAIADGHWHHLSIPISASMSGISAVHSVAFYEWNPDGTSGTMNYWVANVVVKARVLPAAPPTLNLPQKAVPGLNIFATTEGNGFYDRQDVELIQNAGLSWVGHASVANPVTYSFTIASSPASTSCEAWLFLVPNPAGDDNAADWNETNCVVFYIQGSPTNATGYFRYKVNEDHQQAMYSGGSETRTWPANTPTLTNNYIYSGLPGSMPSGPVTNMLSPGVYNITNESGNLATISNPGLVGTWTLRFTSDTDVTVISPAGNTTNFVIPSYNAAYFAESASPAFSIYLGMQANAADAINQAVVYANFAVSNTAAPFRENFLADTVLDTTNVWRTSLASGPKGVLIVPAGADLWLSWNLPDTDFALQTAPVIGDPLAWTSPTAGPLVPQHNQRAQLVMSGEVAAGNAFFELIKRVPTQLQVLLPGETNAPNTLTGKVGTPTPAAANAPVNVTINMVDATFHIVGSTDALSLSSTDASAIISTGTPSLAGGTVTVPVYFSTAGSFTVSASDTTNTNIVAGTSASITIQ